jgi:hypothetical protein
MTTYVFQQKVIKEFRVKTISEEVARELLYNQPNLYLTEETISPEHDQEDYFLVEVIEG